MRTGLLRRTGFVLAVILASAIVLSLIPVRLGLDLRGGTSLILRVKAEAGSLEDERDLVDKTREILVRRINAYGISEAPVQPYGNRGNELLVQIPGAQDTARIANLLESRAVLEWYSVEDGAFASQGEAIARFGGVLPLNRKLVATRPAPDGKRTWYVVDRKPVIRGADVQDARVTGEDEQRPVTRFVLSQDAASRFEKYTRTHLGRQSAIVLDDEVLSAPVIESVIRDTGQIRGARTLEEARDLAIDIRSGALPAAIEIVQERTVEAVLGADSIARGIRAAVAGLAAIVAVMLVYYRRAGVNATLALALNGLLLVSVLASFGAVLTLPGIAGVVLTIGMAVDSNVLIFERIREELRGGKTPVAALAAGFRKAFATLIDTHVTTVVSCAFLFFFGTPEVKGFAATLVIGLITNLFTSVFVSRLAFDWEITRHGGGAAKLSIGFAK